MNIRFLAIVGFAILVVATSLLIEVSKMRVVTVVLAAVTIATLLMLGLMLVTSSIGIPNYL